MAIQVKEKDQQLTEEIVKGMVGKHVHVPTNKHEIPQENGTGVVNAWFAGQVAGYEKAYLAYDYKTERFETEPKVLYNILLTDGMGYMLSTIESEIFELNEQEWTDLLAEHQATQQLKEGAKELIVPEKKKIILPGEGK